MSFHTFDQNNSGGSFDVDPERGIASVVIIEADSAEEANARAEDIGLYFDDSYDIDCDCCGTRWSAAWGDGDDVPTVYGVERSPGDSGGRGWRWTSPEGFIHYADGRIEAIGVDQ
ncbi:hypothetical protein SEA_GARDENSTATE_26 [Microbacterium phage GardenState]|uniref:DUF7296 domain-containing protein n=1 Tax=Microbacterium phage GardenState TaxID=2776841 RepID=A0A7L8ZDD4_9CAUD|nr:hypothetical protein SEA_GARDENSTATE_26 [Microbacterium phage GardenState]